MLTQQQQFNTYYQNLKVQYKLIHYLYNREFACLEPNYRGSVGVRYLRAHNTQAIKFILFDMLKCQQQNKIFNLYYSTAAYNQGISKLPPNLSERDTSDWKQNYWKEIKAVDFFLDIDAPDHSYIDVAKEDTISIVKWFERLGVPTETRFTGCGFHIVIGYEQHFKTIKESLELSFNPKDKNSIFSYYCGLARSMSQGYSELIDYRLNDSRRIIKLPYSLSFYENETYICSPLSQEELKNFKLESYSYEAKA